MTEANKYPTISAFNCSKLRRNGDNFSFLSSGDGNPQDQAQTVLDHPIGLHHLFPRRLALEESTTRSREIRELVP